MKRYHFVISVVIVTLVLFAAVVLAAYVISSSNTSDRSNGPATDMPTVNTLTYSKSKTTNGDSSTATVAEPSLAFLYQTVGQFSNGVGVNTVKIGTSEDGLAVAATDDAVLEWEVGSLDAQSYGDPVFSRLSNGNWAMTAWTSQSDPRGAGQLLYHEAACPQVDDSAVIAIAPAVTAGCSPTKTLTGGKTSQIFLVEDGQYVFHMINGTIYLAKLSDATYSALDLTTLCVLETPVTTLSDLDYGESTLVVDSEELLLSDTAIGQRADGTWVLFVKGISTASGFSGGSLDELCARSIYRTTSTDLIHWSELEKIVEQASVPEATTIDGMVWLYWQDFSDSCSAADLRLGAVAPLSAAYEQNGSYVLSESARVEFPNESFEGNSAEHYATNANPVALPDSAALADVMSCLE